MAHKPFRNSIENFAWRYSAKIYKARELKYLIIAGSVRYLVASVKIDNTPSEFQTARFDPKFIETIEDRVFLLEEFSSKAFSLYSLQRNDRLHLYLRKNQDNPEELIGRTMTFVDGGSTYEMEDKAYIGQLADVLSGCNSLDQKLNSLKYSINNIVDLLKKFDKQCGGNSESYSNDANRKGMLSYVGFAGVTLSNISFSVENFFGVSSDLSTKSSFKSNPSFSFGLNAEYVLPRMKQKLGFLLSVYYNSFKSIVDEYKSYSSPDLFTIKKINIDVAMLHSGLLGRYFLTSGRIKPYLQAGFAVNYVLKHNDKLLIDEYYANAHHEVTSDPFRSYGYKRLQLGFVLGGGLDFNQFHLNYKFESTTGFVNATSVKSAISAQTLVLGYRFN